MIPFFGPTVACPRGAGDAAPPAGWCGLRRTAAGAGVLGEGRRPARAVPRRFAAQARRGADNTWESEALAQATFWPRPQVPREPGAGSRHERGTMACQDASMTGWVGRGVEVVTTFRCRP